MWNSSFALGSRCSLAVGLGMAVLASPLAAQEGVTADSIKVGNIVPYSGSASAYGNIGEAGAACFEMINDKGGINGRKVEFITLDDSYSPPKTVEQTRKLVEREKVALLFNILGTPTNSAIHEYVNQRGVPHLFVISGHQKWGQPDSYPWSMGWQPTNAAEAGVYAAYIKDNVDDPKIGVLFQNDDYGKEWYAEFRAGLGDGADDLIVAAEPYESADPSVDSQVVKLASSGANVLLNISLSKFATQSIRKADEIGWKPLHFLNSVSASVGSILEPAGLDKSEGIITAVYLKDPTDPQFADDADRKEWDAWMDKYYPEGDKTNVFNGYAYAACHTLAHVLEQAGDDLSRESIMKSAANIKDLQVPMLLPGVKINTAPDDFYPIESMQLVRFNGQTFERFGEVISLD